MCKKIFHSTLIFLLVFSHAMAKDSYFPGEKKLVDMCQRDYSSSCTKDLAKLRFKYGVELFFYIKQTDNLEDVELVIAYAESAVELNPNESKYWTFLGEVYSTLHSDIFTTMAIGAFERALKNDSSNNKARLMLASLMYKNGRFYKTTQLIMEAINEDNSLLNEKFAQSLALIYILDNNKQKALEDFKKLKEETDLVFLDKFIEMFNKEKS